MAATPGSSTSGRSGAAAPSTTWATSGCATGRRCPASRGPEFVAHDFGRQTTLSISRRRQWANGEIHRAGRKVGGQVEREAPIFVHDCDDRSRFHGLPRPCSNSVFEPLATLLYHGSDRP